jgi:hypothetical protein
VSGELDPDASGDYKSDGTWNGREAWAREDGNWYIWWQASNVAWVLSQEKGTDLPIDDPFWYGDFMPGLDPVVFAPYPPASGNADLILTTE